MPGFLYLLDMQLIHISEVLTAIRESEEPFDIAYCTYDESRKTGGDRIELKGVLSSRMQAQAKKRGFANPEPTQGIQKRQNHYHNATRNLLLPNGKYKKVHIYLIEFFNGKQMYY